MLREFNVGDIAHMGNNRRVVGDFNLQSTSDEDAKYKRFILKMDDAVEVVAYHKAASHIGYVYDVYYTNDKGEKCFIECIAQTDLYSKKAWERAVEMNAEIKRLEAKLRHVNL